MDTSNINTVRTPTPTPPLNDATSLHCLLPFNFFSIPRYEYKLGVPLGFNSIEMLPNVVRIQRYYSAIRILKSIHQTELKISKKTSKNFDVLLNFVYSWSSYCCSQLHNSLWKLLLALFNNSIWTQISNNNLPEQELQKRYVYIIIPFHIKN